MAPRPTRTMTAAPLTTGAEGAPLLFDSRMSREPSDSEAFSGCAYPRTGVKLRRRGAGVHHDARDARAVHGTRAPPGHRRRGCAGRPRFVPLPIWSGAVTEVLGEVPGVSGLAESAAGSADASAGLADDASGLATARGFAPRASIAEVDSRDARRRGPV